MTPKQTDILAALRSSGEAGDLLCLHAAAEIERLRLAAVDRDAMLLNAEDRVREISLYLWLSFKFPDLFQDTKKAIEARVRLNNFIENSLRQGHFTKKCRRCGKILDFSYRFSICEECHGQNKRGTGSSAGRGGYRGRRRR